MKCVILIFANLVGVSVCWLFAEPSDTAVIGGISTGEIPKKPIEPEPVEKRKFVIKGTHKQKVGNRSVTLHEVEPPKESSIPLTSSAPAREAVKLQQLEEKEYQSPKFIAVSATVYGKEGSWLTKLTVWHGGQTVTCWSNINGHCLIGFAEWRANQRPYWMLATALDASNAKEAEKDGCPVARLQRGGNQPRFIVTDGGKDNGETRQVLGDIHKLYRVERIKLRQAYSLRKVNLAIRANLPKTESRPPKPITIHFWKRDIEKENMERGVK